MIRVALIVAGLFVFSATTLAYYAYHRDIAQARERVATGGQILQTPCGPIEYAAIGEGKPVLVVHGAGGGYDQGLDFARPLADRGLRLIAMSRFGYLRTPLPGDPSAAAQADAHACLLDALGVRQAAVIGASAGAPSSLQFALRHPQRCNALVLLVPAAYVPRPAGGTPLRSPAGTQLLFDTALKSDFLFWAVTKLARQTVIRAILATPPAVLEIASADEKARVAQVLDNILPISPRRRGLMNDAAVISSLRHYELERISAPTLVISTADDLFGTFDTARYTAGQIPHARFVSYSSGGHLWVGHQDEVISEISGVLK
jgi:pimeloyl-ACP methyl ester carboxylesterase